MASRQEEKARRKREREEAERRAAAEARRKRRLQILGGSVLAVVVVVAAAVAVAAGGGGGGGTSKASVSQVRQAAAAAGCRTLNFPKGYQDRTHTTSPVHYKTNPPSYGPHNPVPAQDGDYAGRTTPAKEHLVHALEHGRIEVQYAKSLAQADIKRLEKLVNDKPKYMLLFQNETHMPYQVAAVAWTHILGCNSYNPRVDKAIATFRDAYTLKGPEYIPAPE